MSLSQETRVRRDNLKLKYLKNKIFSTKKKRESLPKTVDELNFSRKAIMNIAEQHHEMKVAMKRYFTVDRQLFAERVQNRLDRKHARLALRIEKLNQEAADLLDSLELSAKEFKEHASEQMNETVGGDRFNFFRRTPIPETQ
jgi:hypothetical protein